MDPAAVALKASLAASVAASLNSPDALWEQPEAAVSLARLFTDRSVPVVDDAMAAVDPSQSAALDELNDSSSDDDDDDV